MVDYQPPLKEIQFVLDEIVGLESHCALFDNENVDSELVPPILNEAARLAAEKFAPMNWVGDQNPCQLVDDKVQETAGFKEVYQEFSAGGWDGLANDPEHGGMGLPEVVDAACVEMWTGANVALSLCATLTHGAVHAISECASDSLKQTYLPNMVSGAWTGTMNLTEPQSGSDLSVIKTKAVPEGDHFRITGTKIFITWGDHQMADNIIHLVLARTPDAPDGVKGISLFLVPKFMVNDDGSLGDRNDVYCQSLEEKLGIHASPTCVMGFGQSADSEGAIGYLVGQENRGLMNMFVMMNSARLHVGLEGVGLGERAYQHAKAYALDRVQGVPLGGDQRAVIAHHPDVRRMLLEMKSLTQAMRCLCYYAYAQLDRSKLGDNEALARVEYLTPIAKAWSTELAIEIASTGVQVHGGMGYIEETGAAQYLRDARITTIYEGTTGIQAADLIGRKLSSDNGGRLKLLLKALRDELLALDDAGLSLKPAGEDALSVIDEAADWILTQGRQTVETLGSAAHHFLMLNGVALGGYFLIKAALIAKAKYAHDPVFADAQIRLAQFYVQMIMPRVEHHACALRASADVILKLEDAQL